MSQQETPSPPRHNQLPAELVESLSDSLAALLVAEWRRRHSPRLILQGGLTITEYHSIKSKAYDGQPSRFGAATGQPSPQKTETQAAST